MGEVKVPLNYGALSERGRDPTVYTIKAVAEARGLRLTRATSVIDDWKSVFAVADQETLLQHRLAKLGIDIEDAGVDEAVAKQVARVRKHIQDMRRELPGEYLVGGPGPDGKGHFMNMTIETDGRVVGYDPQDGRLYQGLEAIRSRLGDFRLKLKAVGLERDPAR